MSRQPQLIYTGVGSQNTPVYILRLMRVLSFQLCRHGWKLRTGDVNGADTAFVQGVRNLIEKLNVEDIHGQFVKEPKSLMEIYCPNYYKPANKRPGEYIVPSEDSDVADASYYTHNFHPTPQALNHFARKITNRSAHQILGKNLYVPVRFVVCWTEDGGRTDPIGHTGQAVRIAAHYNIPVYNLKNDEDYVKMWKWIKWMKEN